MFFFSQGLCFGLFDKLWVSPFELEIDRHKGWSGCISGGTLSKKCNLGLLFWHFYGKNDMTIIAMMVIGVWLSHQWGCISPPPTSVFSPTLLVENERLEIASGDRGQMDSWKMNTDMLHSVWGKPRDIQMWTAHCKQLWETKSIGTAWFWYTDMESEWLVRLWGALLFLLMPQADYCTAIITLSSPLCRSGLWGLIDRAMFNSLIISIEFDN